MQIHYLVTVWKCTGNSISTTNHFEKDRIIYIPNWQKEKR